MLDPRRRSDDDDSGEAYERETFPLPTGDLNGDGTPEVFVKRCIPDLQNNTRRATLPLDVLSGRDGRHLWEAGPLPMAFEAFGYSNIQSVAVFRIGPGTAPDVLVEHASAFVKGGLPPRWTTHEPHLARLSGREGRVLWDTTLSDRKLCKQVWNHPPPFCDDLDGDGSLDALTDVYTTSTGSDCLNELVAISLRDGKAIWSTGVNDQFNWDVRAFLAVADLDADKRPEVIVAAVPGDRTGFEYIVKALEGRDGSVLWTWRSGPVRLDQVSVAASVICLADFPGGGARNVCVGFNDAGKKQRLIILDARGREVARRELPGDFIASLGAADLNGDEQDELLLTQGNRFSVLGADLKELWSPPPLKRQPAYVVPAAPGRSGTVMIYPAQGLDGADGRLRWAGQFPIPEYQNLLDAGDSSRPPLLTTPGIDSTVCRMALPTDTQGKYQTPRGVLVKPGLNRNDPRWEKPLPWLRARGSPAAPAVFFGAGGLALLSFVVPVLIIRLAAGSRPWSVRGIDGAADRRRRPAHGNAGAGACNHRALEPAFLLCQARVHRGRCGGNPDCGLRCSCGREPGAPVLSNAGRAGCYHASLFARDRGRLGMGGRKGSARCRAIWLVELVQGDRSWCECRPSAGPAHARTLRLVGLVSGHRARSVCGWRVSSVRAVFHRCSSLVPCFPIRSRLTGTAETTAQVNPRRNGESG